MYIFAAHLAKAGTSVRSQAILKPEKCPANIGYPK
jgi:hypothetical protein